MTRSVAGPPTRGTRWFWVTVLACGILVATVAGVKSAPRESPVDVVVDPVGYLQSDQNKTFLVKARDEIDPPAFSVVNSATDLAVLQGQTVPLGELWGYHYYIGNFTTLTVPGNYTVVVTSGGARYRSYEFEVSDEAYLGTLDLLYKFFYYQRCGCEVVDDVVPGYVGHEPCHLDDAVNGSDATDWVNLTGGWHDAGDYNKYHSTTATSLLGLCLSFEMGERFYSRADLCDDYPARAGYEYQSDDTPDLLEEVVWGALFVEKLVGAGGAVVDAVGSNDFQGWYGYTGIPSLETDGNPGTPDDRAFKPPAGWAGMQVAAALLRVAALLNGSTPYSVKFGAQLASFRAAGERAYGHYRAEVGALSDAKRAGWQLLADLALYDLTGDPSYWDEANQVGWELLYGDLYDYADPGFGHTGIDQVPAYLFYWVERNGSAAVRAKYAEDLRLHWDSFWFPLSSPVAANNYYGVLRARTASRGEFYFWDDSGGGWNVGQNSYYAVAAWAAALAYNATGDPEFLDFALRQVHWIFGMNPFSLTMVEGVGEKNLPAYHNRGASLNGNYRGQVPGCVPNGLIRDRNPDPATGQLPDSPWYDQRVATVDTCSAEYKSNEPWIPHDSNFLLALTALYKYGLVHGSFISHEICKRYG
ncbi:MAG: glycoside hydrolase family 9 protein [Promethearchaeota archaeon]